MSFIRKPILDLDEKALESFILARRSARTVKPTQTLKGLSKAWGLTEAQILKGLELFLKENSNET